MSKIYDYGKYDVRLAVLKYVESGQLWGIGVWDNYMGYG